MVTVDVEGRSLYQCTHTPSWLAWSDAWPGAQFAFIRLVGMLEFNVPFQHKYGYIRDERSGMESYPYPVKEG